MTWNAPLETGGVLVGDKVNLDLEVEAVLQAAPVRSERLASPDGSRRAAPRSEIGVGEREARPFEDTRADTDAVEQQRPARSGPSSSLGPNAGTGSDGRPPQHVAEGVGERRVPTGRGPMRLTGPATSLVSR